MTLQIADRVWDTTATTGTGVITLAGSPPNAYQSFGSVCANNDTIYYALAGRTANVWEIGLGTYGTAGPTLTRTTVLASSSGGAAVTLAGITDVLGVWPANQIGKTFTSAAAGWVPASGGGTTNFLRADGSFAAPPSSSPGGSNTQVQYNNSSAFGGITNLTSNGTNPLLTAIAAPASPASGFGVFYEDSTSLTFSFKNASGTVSNTVVASAAAAHQFATAVSTAGAVTYTQPAFSDISGAATVTQVPASDFAFTQAV